MAAQLPASPPRRKHGLFLLIVASLLIVLCVGCVFVVLYSLTNDGSRLSLGGPSMSSTSAPLTVIQAHPNVAKGLACKLVGTGEECEQILFIRKQRIFARIELTATAAALDLTGLTYVLYDANGAEVARGPLALSGSLKQGESRAAEIVDAAIQQSKSMMIRR
jgi:hypothetical protein